MADVKEMKKIEIIPIAKKKSGRRRIPEEWITETLNFPSQTVEGYGGRKVAHKTYRIENKEPRPQGGALKPKLQDRDPEPSSG